jgi:alanyl-tRNA synthetase
LTDLNTLNKILPVQEHQHKLLYFSEPYLQQIRTKLVDQKQDERGNWFAFQQTIFYPQGGGQSADHGWINGCEVRDVQKDGETVWHLLMEKLPPEAEMKLDWNHRYDNMRQHSGQHVLSASFSRLFNLETVSVHLGSENTLIELNTPGITPEQLQAAEEYANGVIAQNLTVKQMWIYRDDLTQYNLRRDIKVDDDPIRVIQIGEHDCTGCGGLHVQHTAEIGLIKITGTEKIRRHIRVHSKIGRPAYTYYSRLNEQVQRLCTLLSMEIDDLPARVQTMLDEQRELNRQLKSVTEKWLMAYAAELHSGGPCGFFMIADLAAEQANILCGFWLARNNKPCLIASGGPLRQLNFTMRSPAGHKQNVLGFLQKHGQEFSLKGGGSADFVQGVINQSSADTTYSARLQKQFEDYFTKQE